MPFDNDTAKLANVVNTTLQTLMGNQTDHSNAGDIAGGVVLAFLFLILAVWNCRGCWDAAVQADADRAALYRRAASGNQAVDSYGSGVNDESSSLIP